MSNTSMRSLTSGSPMKLILSFLLPVLLGMLFQQFYNMVDTLVVGQFLGVRALAGVGSTGSVNFLVLGLCNGLCAGFAIPAAQKYGMGDYSGLRKCVGNALWLTGGFAAAVTAITTAGCGSILRLMGTPEEVFGYAYPYIFLIFLGIPATMLYNLVAGILRSLGDSKTPLYFLIFSSLLNVALDLGLILGAGLGVAGAGLATLISQLVSGLLCLRYALKHYPLLRPDREALKADRQMMGQLLAMGLPMGLQYSITAIGSILLQSAVNALGADAMAAVTAGSKVSNLLVCPLDAIGSTAATFAGQNIGAGKPRRVHDGVRDASLLGLAYCAVMLPVLARWGDGLIGLFLSGSEASGAEILGMSRRFLLSNGCFYGALLYVNLLRFTIQGLGYSRLALFAGLFEMAARSVFGLCLVPMLGFRAVVFANPAAWLLADAFLLAAYRHCLAAKGYQAPRLQKKAARVHIAG